MKLFVTSILALVVSSSAVAGSCNRPASMDGFPEQWQTAAGIFYDKLEQLVTEDVPSHTLLHATMKQLNQFTLVRHLRKNGCHLGWVISVIKEKTTALKNYLVHADFADLPDNQKASALQRFNYRMAMAKTLTSSETYRAYAEYYAEKDAAYQVRGVLDKARTKRDRDARTALTKERLKLLREYHEQQWEIRKVFLAELKAEKAQERPVGRTK